MYIGFHVKYRSTSKILMKHSYFPWTFEKSQISNFINTHPMEAHLFHADGRKDERSERQTDRQTQLTVVFRNFTKAPTTESV